MSKRNLKILLEEILEEIQRIQNFTKNIHSAEDFVKNDLVFYATLKCLENIGEAVKKIPQEKRDLVNFNWKKVAGLRDILIHEYFSIDHEIIWDIVENKLQELEIAVKKLLQLEEGCLANA